MWPYTEDELEFITKTKKKNSWFTAFKICNTWIKIKAAD